VAIIQGLARKNLIHPPKWLPDNVHYLTDMGSVAYGTATGDAPSKYLLKGFRVCSMSTELAYSLHITHVTGEADAIDMVGEWS
jgi:hypothetical protein